MQRLGRNAVMPEPGEVLDFEAVYGVPFGTHGKITVSFGDRTRDDNVDEICVKVNPTTTENTVGFTAANSNMDALAGPRELLAAEYPGALADSPGLIGVRTYPNGGRLEGFVSQDGKDPLAAQPVLGFDPGSGKVTLLQRPARPAFPAGGFYITLRRTQGHSGNHPLALTYYGTDDISNGGEVAIIQPDGKAAANPGGPALFMQIGDIQGVFIPKVGEII